MKKNLLIVLFLLVSFFLGGCGNESNNKVDELSHQLQELQDQLLNLDIDYQNLQLSTEDYEGRIAYLEAQRLQTRTQIENLERQLQDMDSPTASEIKIFLADKYYLVPNDNFQLFYRSILQTVNPYHYYIKLTGTVGNAYNRYYEFKPETSDDGKSYSLKVEVCDDNGNVLGSKSTTLVVSSANNTAPAKNVLVIGDSLTANGYWVSYGASKYANAGGGTINLIGTIQGSYGSLAKVKYEGRGGWQWSSFVKGYDSVTPSPFRSNSGTGISFIDYTARNSFSSIDELYILMTWNGIGGSFRTFSFLQEPFASAKALIDQFHKDYPNAKITLMGIPQPSVNAGLGAYYTINSSYGDNYGQFVTALNYNKFLEDWAKSSEYSSFMRYVDVKGQFDSEYNMPTESKPVNNQSPVTEQVGNSMGMHPSTNGYLQIGDVFYRALCHEWN